MIEVWKDIPGYEGYYQASDLGRIRSMERIENCGHGATRTRKGRVLRESRNTHGYAQVSLRGSPKSVHRLILLTFVGEPAEGSTFACHRDGDRGNNALSNLYWGCPKTNSQDTIRHGRQPRGEEQGLAKLTEADIRRIKLMHQNGTSLAAIAKEIGKVGVTTICQVTRGKTWKHVV